MHRVNILRKFNNLIMPATTPNTLILFGPQITRLLPSHLAELRAIINDPNFSFLLDVVKELPSLWPLIRESCDPLRHIPGQEQLQQLENFFDTGELPQVEPPNNIILAPLTVLAQVAEYLRLGRTGNTQGFCVGFLAAAVVASAQSETELQQLAAAAVRLAVCIGAAIDLDKVTLDPQDRSFAYSVHWTSTAEKTHLEKALASFPKVCFPANWYYVEGY